MDVEVSSDEDEEDETEATPAGQQQDDAGVQVSGLSPYLCCPPVGPPDISRGFYDEHSYLSYVERKYEIPEDVKVMLIGSCGKKCCYQ